jgi:phosphoglycolate phosphatase
LKRNCLLFDLDGTLVHSAPDLAASLNRRLEALGRTTLDLEAVTAMVGNGFQKLLERALLATGGPLPQAEFEAVNAAGLADYFENATTLTRPYPGVAETLKALKDQGCRMAVCTNKPVAPSWRILEDLGLAGFFEALAGGDSYTVRKPDPGHIKALLEEMGVAPREAVMIGDSSNDLLAARGAGLPTVLLTYGYCPEGAANLRPDALAESFTELPEILRRLP